ncbi:MAG: hypothetical protein RXS23_10915, partial [Metallosphaera yellowstonensis]
STSRPHLTGNPITAVTTQAHWKKVTSVQLYVSFVEFRRSQALGSLENLSSKLYLDLEKAPGTL